MYRRGEADRHDRDHLRTVGKLRGYDYHWPYFGHLRLFKVGEVRDKNLSNSGIETKRHLRLFFILPDIGDFASIQAFSFGNKR